MADSRSFAPHSPASRARAFGRWRRRRASAWRTGALAATATAMLTGVLAGSLLVAGPTAPAAAASSTKASASTCDLKALATHRGTVTIDFWESMVTANGKTLTTLTTKFNSSQSKIHVTLVQQSSYTTTWTKYQAGLSNGQLPDVVQLTTIDLQGIVDSQSALPVQDCIDAGHYSTSDYVSRALDSYKVDGEQIGMPFAVSTPVLIYNKLAFSAAGISSPPATLNQMVTDAATLKAHGSGMGLKLDPWYLEQWLATANQYFVSDKNGRSGRATKAVFDTAAAKKIWTELAEMVKSGDATTNPAQGTPAVAYANLLGIGTGAYGMTVTTSAVLGTVSVALSGGAYPDVQLGVAPYPKYTSKVKGGVSPGGSALYISSKAPKVDQAAAWDYIQFLDDVTSQATWAAGTGYIPIRKSATTSATVQSLWQRTPGYKVAYDQLVNGVDDTATEGAVIGPYPQVRQDELTVEEAMFAGTTSPPKAVKSVVTKIDKTLSQYNQRIGAS